MKVKSIEKVHFSAMLDDIYLIIFPMFSGLKTPFLKIYYSILHDGFSRSPAFLSFFLTNEEMKQKSVLPTKLSLNVFLGTSRHASHFDITTSSNKTHFHLNTSI